MTFTKDKQSIKYFCLAFGILIGLYLSKISDLFIPLFDNVYYGNLVVMFVAVSNMIIWGIEIGLLIFLCKKFNMQLFSKEKKELPLKNVIILFVLTLVPMLIMSACVGWKVKIVYDLGVKVTAMTLLCNACQMLSYAVRMVLIIMFIASVQKGFEMIFKTKYVIPYGAIVAILTFGLIDFFVLGLEFRVFYLIVSFLYGIIFLIAKRKLGVSWVLCYLIHLL